MLDIKALLPELKKLVADLSEDMLKRVGKNKEIGAGLENAYKQIEKGGRTAQAYEVWLEDYLDQVAVAWVLSCVFVRFMEDNELIDECYLAGSGDRRTKAENEHEIYFREHPHDSDREYFEHVFRAVGQIPACIDLFAEGKTPVWAVGPSGDSAMRLLEFWRDVDIETGNLRRDFRIEQFDARFLGDLYQDLSERAQEKFALLQTPVFIEQFILSRTLIPAIDVFGLNEIRLIDPTCGSGHFLLGAFEHLFDLFSKENDNEIVAAQRALEAIWGVDINPFAVAIARFRLIVRAMQACRIEKLRNAPRWTVNLAAGDSLLFGHRWTKGELLPEQRWLGEKQQWAPDIYACEDKEAISQALTQQYHVVVGNPPYITAKDKAANAAYRDRYRTAFKKFHLSTPFTERFFELSLHSSNGGEGGFVGLIKDNAFMKRDFGKKLIDDFLPGVDVSHLIDTAGVYIPGHGTPTVIVLGRNRPPTTDTVRAVLGIKGEPGTPDDPSKGYVWLEILKYIDVSGAEGEYVSTSDLSREKLKKHPWSIGGGGAGELFDEISDRFPEKLKDATKVVGIFGMTNSDDVFMADNDSFGRKCVEPELIRQLQIGDEIRDWSSSVGNYSLFPYLASGELVNIEEYPNAFKWMWPAMIALGNRVTFNKTSYLREGLSWWKWHQVSIERIRIPRTIAFAFVATHNHFVLDYGGKVFNRSAPIIKLGEDASEDEHLELLGLLNSSVGCFWMKQVFFPKGGDPIGTEGARVRKTLWDVWYEFATTQMKNFPLPEERPLELARQLHALAQERSEILPKLLSNNARAPAAEAFSTARERWETLKRQLVALQEELDWFCYRAYGLLDEDLCFKGDVPAIDFSERAFEVVMGQEVAMGKLETPWFERHDSTPKDRPKNDWSPAYREVVENRISAITGNKAVRILEQPEYKRRWLEEPWEDQQRDAIRVWLLRRIESEKYWGARETASPKLMSVSELADAVSDDNEFRSLASICRGRSDFDIGSLVSDLVASDSVPCLPNFLFTATGLKTYAIWQRTWVEQRNATSSEAKAEIKNPPKFTAGCFQTSRFWQLRGKCNIPKERFISFPHFERDSDPSLVVGWAGWDHLQQATAVVAYYDARKRDGWTVERLTPLLLCLDQLLPWIHQWHPEIDVEYNETPGTSFQTLLESETQELGLTLEHIRSWTPPKKKSTPRKKVEA